LSEHIEALAGQIDAQLQGRATRMPALATELTIEVADTELLNVAWILRDHPELHFETLIDVTVVDYSQFRLEQWATHSATDTGFSRGRIRNNWRIRLRVKCENEAEPVVDSVVDIWASANWFEREAFDLFGVLFRNHPDLRRILTDYGFVGHPFRKDFPLSGNVEVRYDAERKRVVYQPVSIEPRVLVPRVIRDDNRYNPALKDAPPK
jgi:NADH-quinone oxidoreductase subunit C